MTEGPVLSDDRHSEVDKPPPTPARRSGWTPWIRGVAVAVFDALVVFAVPQLVSNQSWTLLALMVGAAIAVNWAYLSPRTSASRWLTPGLILMVIFVAYPVIYTSYISLTNWRTGNILTKEQVINNLEAREIRGADGGVTLDLSIYRNPAGNLAFLVGGEGVDPYMGLARPATDDPLGDGAVDIGGVAIDPEAPPETIGDFELLQGLAVTAVASQLETLVVDLPDGSIATVETLQTARVSQAGQRFVYDPAADTITDNEAGRTCDAGQGNFFCNGVPEEEVARAAIIAADSVIECEGGMCNNVPLFAIDGSLPGWRTAVGFTNYETVFTNEAIRGPFLRVLAWNVVFAFGTVFLAFAMGLGLAIALKSDAMRGKALYRSIYILPYAIPAFLSIFVWRGLLNTEFGKVNGLLDTFGVPGVDWLGNTVWAMAAVLLVNLWLGFPYMFLISTGALTSIPEDLLEAARVDGAGAWGTFRRITLPLLLVSTAPLLIGAFAYNFNNVVLILLLTQGGPPLAGFDVPVGGTDILISFTFNLASGAGRGQQFALASAIVVIIFIVLAIVSASSFRLTKRLEEYYG